MDPDPGASTWLYIAGLLGCFLFSSFFSIVKIVFTSLDKNAIPADNERLRYFASKIEDIAQQRGMLATTVSFSKSVFNTAFVVLAVGLTRELLPQAATWQILAAALAGSVLLLTVFAYAIPRAFALRFAHGFVPATFNLYNVMSGFFIIFTAPLNWFYRMLLKLLGYDERFAFLSPEEKLRMKQDAEGEEALDQSERDMIHSIFELGETTVREIMVPRVDIEALEIKTDFDTVLKFIKEVGHSRIPVYRDNIDSIVGILYAKDVLSWIGDHGGESRWNMEELLKKPHFVPDSKMIDDLMAEFKRKQIHLAIVVDEYGGTAGIVTMEDILEEIVGDIQDEYDVEEKMVIEVSPNIYHVDPHVSLHDLADELDITLDLEEVDYSTLGGLVYDEYGDVPQEGAMLEYSGMKITVLEMDNQRIEKVRIEVRRSQPEPVNAERDVKNG